jgi:hypothetical protein
MESEDVASVNVFRTGDRAINARKIRIDEMDILEPALGCQAVFQTFFGTRSLTSSTPILHLYSIRVHKLPHNVSGYKESNRNPDKYTGIEHSFLESHEDAKEYKYSGEMLGYRASA